MNFEPDIILAPQHGNNSDARTVSVHVMNNIAPTPGQWAGLAGVFEDHRTQVRNSLAGFHTSSGRLADGSQYEIVSNSGMHSVMLWPAGGDVLPVLVEEFWGIPANATHSEPGSGYPASGIWNDNTPFPESGRWRVATNETRMPPALRQARFMSIAESKAHFGHVTWSSPQFKADGHEIVLTWRGPRDRYSGSSGWSTATGGSVQTHFNSTADFDSNNLGEKVFKDFATVWINGARKNLPTPKIVAACLHCPDPIGAPGMVVLRVATDNYSGDLTTRKLGVKDLVPTGATAPVSIAQLVNATSYVVLTGYNFAGEGPAGWRMLQRPHFNQDGTKLATVITAAPYVVALNATTGAVVDSITLEGTSIRGGTQSISTTDTGGAGVPNTTRTTTLTINRTETSDVTTLTILGVDFLGAQLIACWRELREQRTNTGQELDTSTFTYGPDGLQVSGTFQQDHSITLEATNTLSVKHTVHGTLLTRTNTLTETGTYIRAVSGALSGTNSGAVTFPTQQLAFVADLSRDVFALACSQTNSATRSGKTSSSVLSETFPGYGFYVQEDMQHHSEPFLFDIWMAGIRRATAVTGSFPPEASTSGPVNVNAGKGYVSNNHVGRYRDNGNFLAPPTISTTPTTLQTFNFASSTGGPSLAIAGDALVRWYQCAVNARRSVAYFGILHRRTTIDGSGVPLIDFGLEAACFLDEDGVFTLATVPPYAGGTFPTISAPVFPGVRREELTT